MKETLASTELRGRFPEERLQDARRAAEVLSKPQVDALFDSHGEVAVVEALVVLGGRLPTTGVRFDAQTVVDSIDAQAERRVLMADGDFRERLLRGDVRARDQLTDLHEQSYPPLPGGHRG